MIRRWSESPFSTLSPVEQVAVLEEEPECMRELVAADAKAGWPGGAVSPTRIDPDEDDVRLLAHAPEVGRVLQQRQRTNTLSATLRELFDSGRAQALTRKEPRHVQNAHVSLIGHITPDELQLLMTWHDLASGYFNRILWCGAYRRRCEPFGREWGEEEEDLAHAVGAALYRREAEADRPEAVSRGAVLMLRIAAIYAAQACTPQVTPEHLLAAEEVWRYCRERALLMLMTPGGAVGAPFTNLERKLLKLIGEAPEGLTRAELVERTQRNYLVPELQQALDALGVRRLLERVDSDDPKKPRWRLPADLSGARGSKS